MKLQYAYVYGTKQFLKVFSYLVIFKEFYRKSFANYVKNKFYISEKTDSSNKQKKTHVFLGACYLENKSQLINANPGKFAPKLMN